MLSLRIVVDLHAVVNGMKVFSVTMETQQCFPFVLLLT